MATFTIDAVEHKKNFGAGTQYGEKSVYKLTLVDENGEPIFADVKQLATSPEPQQGTKVEGELVETDFGLEFKRKFNGAARRSGGGQRSPQERDSIVRQHSQHMAIMYVALQQKRSPEINPNFPYLKGIIDWFDRDAKGESQP